jgi:bacillopeptidase F (M6 metalloprotease family)
MNTDELKKLVEAATPGPWKVVSEPGSKRLETGDGAIMGDEPYYPWAPDNDADWQLMAASPDLAREVIALREAAGELADAAEQSYQAAHDYRVTSNAASAEASLRADQEFRTALATLRAVLGESE